MAVPHTQTSGAARLAVLYITGGAIIDVWTALWYIWMRTHEDAGSDSSYFWCYGLFLTGLVLLIIGLALGRIGRAARHAEAPVDATAPAQQAIARPAVAPVPGAPVATAIPTNGQVAAPGAAPGGAVAPGVVQPR